jgi:predicted phosphate transport protein (TIGR00153 family)
LGLALLIDTDATAAASHDLEGALETLGRRCPFTLRSPGYGAGLVRFRLLPTDDRFFELFNDAAANVAVCARRLRDLLDGAEGGFEAVVACERRGDELIREILRRLNTSFVTPFDREDIHALAEQLDDVVDDVMEVGYRLELGTRDVAAMPELKLQADLLVRMADETVALIGQLASMKGVGPHLDAVDRLESEGDAVYRQALARLYSGELKASATLYWKDVVEALEAALDALEDASDVIEGIVLKHA